LVSKKILTGGIYVSIAMKWSGIRVSRSFNTQNCVILIDMHSFGEMKNGQSPLVHLGKNVKNQNRIILLEVRIVKNSSMDRW
jgi:hypothetical protein